LFLLYRKLSPTHGIAIYTFSVCAGFGTYGYFVAPGTVWVASGSGYSENILLTAG
jgi:hypothetical protein